MKNWQVYPPDHKGSKWIRYEYDSNIDSWFPHEKPGAYVIYGNGKLLYVGQAINVRKRFYNYRLRFGYGGGIITPWGYFHSIVAKIHYSEKYGDWAMREIRLIRRLRPPMNCVGSIKKRRMPGEEKRSWDSLN